MDAPTPARAYAEAMAGSASAEDRYVLLLAMLDAVAAGDDPERAGADYEAGPGDLPLGTLVDYDDDRLDPPQGVGVVIGYSAWLNRSGRQERHQLICDDGAFRGIDRDRLTAR